MTVLVAVLLGLLGPMAAVAVLNLLTAPRLHRLAPAVDGPRVSVLVPVRDEAENLHRLLPALAASRYRRLEVLVLDDGSSDGSAAVVRSRASRDPRFRLLQGTDPPPGWTGKNWACHLLARAADGERLIFCDADVVPGPDAVGRTVAALEGESADVVTAFPRHRRGRWFEEAVVPMIAKVPVAALLPLVLVRPTRTVSLAAGNGQWMAWRRAAYAAVDGHARVRDEVLEDVKLARAAKADRLRLAPFIATRDLQVRMYTGPSETWEGFGKNLYPLLGGRDRTALPALGLFVALTAVPIALPLAGGSLAWAPLAALGTVRLAAAALFRDGALSVLLHPVGVVAAAGLLLSSRRRHRSGRVTWKRRIVVNGRTEMDQVILVDPDDRPIGTAEKMDVHRDGRLHRAFSVVVLSDADEVLLQRRADDKYHSGGLWSNSCCSHPRPGETVIEAAHRRLREELGFDCPLVPVSTFVYRAEVDGGFVEHELDHVLLGRWTGTPRPDPAEVSAWRWRPLPEIRDEISRHPGRFTAWLPRVIAEVDRDRRERTEHVA